MTLSMPLGLFHGVTLGFMHVFLLTLGLLHVFLMSRDTWFNAWVTLGLLHAFLLTRVACILHESWHLVYCMGNTWLAACVSRDDWFVACIPQGHDTWFIARVTLGLLHVFFLTLDFLNLACIPLEINDIWFITWVTLSLLQALLLTFGMHFRHPTV